MTSPDLPAIESSIDDSARGLPIPGSDNFPKEDVANLDEDDQGSFKLKKKTKEWKAKSPIQCGPDFIEHAASFGPLLQNHDPSRPFIDHACLKIHYKQTVFLLLFCAAFVVLGYMTGPYGGMHCYYMDSNGDGNKLNQEKPEKSAISSFCWITSILVGSDPIVGDIGRHKISAGLSATKTGNKDDNRTFYQFIPHILVCQAIFFYAPHYLWKMFERKKIDSITTSMRNKTLCPDHYKQASQTLADYLFETLHYHNLYAFQFYFCGILCLVNVGVQMMVINRLFDRVFTIHGLEVLAMTLRDINQRDDRLMLIFPRMSRCLFQHYGPSGTIMNKDIVCLLPHNLVSEKVFVFLWFWFVFIAFLAVWYMLYISLTVFVPSSIREVVFKRKHPRIPDASLKVLFDVADTGDWFVLYLLSMNLDSNLFADFVKAFTKKFKQAP